jgi:hypothetical protein
MRKDEEQALRQSRLKLRNELIQHAQQADEFQVDNKL